MVTSKGVYLPILKLHSILEVPATLFAHKALITYGYVIIGKIR